MSTIASGSESVVAQVDSFFHGLRRPEAKELREIRAVAMKAEKVRQKALNLAGNHAGLKDELDGLLAELRGRLEQYRDEQYPLVVAVGTVEAPACRVADGL